jgi:hypothetical protein
VYFPRTPWEKSYSFRICLSADLFDVFFITPAFSSASTSRANDADIIVSLRVNDNEQFPGKSGTHRHMTFLCARMVWVGNRQREWIAENGRRFFEADAMLGKVRPSFSQIPFER